MTRKNSLLNSALIASLSLVISALSHAQSPTSDGSPASINARADYFRLDNAYIPPPGEALHHYTAGFAKILCSAVFVTGLDPVDAHVDHRGTLFDPIAGHHLGAANGSDHDIGTAIAIEITHARAAASDALVPWMQDSDLKKRAH